VAGFPRESGGGNGDNGGDRGGSGNGAGEGETLVSISPLERRKWRGNERGEKKKDGQKKRFVPKEKRALSRENPTVGKKSSLMCRQRQRQRQRQRHHRRRPLLP